MIETYKVQLKPIQPGMRQTTKTSRDINATPGKIYLALTDPILLAKWQVPGDMKAKVHYFDLKVGGGYQMSLFYPDNEVEFTGKTSDKEDKFTAKFVELIPDTKIVMLINFDTSDPNYSGEMTMEVNLEPIDTGTRVTFLFENIPVGIRPEDNEAGASSSLEKLAKLVER